MPRQGRVDESAYTDEEQAAMGQTVKLLGENYFRCSLNDTAYWCTIPAAVWNYKLGGYQVHKKLLSYRGTRPWDAPSAWTKSNTSPTPRAGLRPC